MTRRVFIERALRQIYGGQPSDDATITIGLVNVWLEDAIGLAAKANNKENIAIDGISYINNSFYINYKGIPVYKYENFIYKITLPHLPLGIGTSSGISTLEFKDASTNQISFPVVWLSESQRSYHRGMRSIPNKILAYSQGEFIYVLSTILLSQYTANVTMISGGDSTNLDSTLNVPSDYFPVMVQYIREQLLLEKAQPVDSTNDGLDALRTT